jgi:hypothetical protein
MAGKKIGLKPAPYFFGRLIILMNKYLYSIPWLSGQFAGIALA